MYLYLLYHSILTSRACWPDANSAAVISILVASPLGASSGLLQYMGGGRGR